MTDFIIGLVIGAVATFTILWGLNRMFPERPTGGRRYPGDKGQ